MSERRDKLEKVQHLKKKKKVIISEQEKPANKTPCLRVSNESVFSTIALMETTNESGQLGRNK